MFHNHTLYEQKIVKTDLHLVFSYRNHSCCCEIFYSVKYSTLLEDLISLACKKKIGFLFVCFFFVHFLLHHFLSCSKIRKTPQKNLTAMIIFSQITLYVFRVLGYSDK